MKLNSRNKQAVERLFPMMGVIFDYDVSNLGITMVAKLNISRKVITLINDNKYKLPSEFIIRDDTHRVILMKSFQVAWQSDMVSEMNYQANLLLDELKIQTRRIKIKLMMMEIIDLNKEMKDAMSFHNSRNESEQASMETSEYLEQS